ncbi:4,4'-diaponeurosporenoate glycosyltransferase [Rosistilla ulvae]|uniref:4,4'-diaponeurosporenoate glycosyltransferase n=1 Tax=Rosistilla ulvae TaxID=1930277 RepID=A0A517LYL9_9BACT|nr:glycosyltransferase family A protein [Rosistilla ulvae]QDS87718.1 4,4'-diaponeurosporenoate glycosyltransferase [Rosistilla ulvae]
MIAIALASLCLLLTGIPAAMIAWNLCCFRRLPTNVDDRPSPVSVLIPARNEAAGIAATLEYLLASDGVDLEVVVLDDDSQDATAAIVAEFAERDSRVRICRSGTLPRDWNGKQFACWQLSKLARHDRWLFLDADVQVAPDAIARLSHNLDRRAESPQPLALLSSFPHQETVGWIETAIVPLMHFVLLGFLPIWRMQRTTDPAYAAGCGQMFMTDRHAYELAGGHAAIAASRHDGIKLPRAYRQAELMTDVIDGTDLASVRMYRSGSEVIDGVMKNADEALARPALIVPVTLFCLAPLAAAIALIVFAVAGKWIACAIGAFAFCVATLSRVASVRRFRQPLASAWLHPFALVLFAVLQWIALWRHIRGRRVAWRGRIES